MSKSGAEAMGQAATDAIKSGRFHGVIAYLDAEKRVQYVCFTNDFPIADAGRVEQKIRAFNRDIIGATTGKTTL